MRFRREKSGERSRPAFSCCSVSISISCCSLPAFIGVIAIGLLLWFGLRSSQDEARRRAES